MSGATERLPRLLALLPWLRARPGVALASAAAAFGVTPAVLRSDLELLFCCGLPGGSPGDLIDISFEGDTVTVVDAQTLDRPLRLTADEALALLVAARALADVPGLTERAALERVVAKLEAVAGTAGPPSGAAAVAIEGGERSVLDTVRTALDEHRRVHLSYLVESRDELTERDVDVLRVVGLEGRFYVEGYCHRAEAVRLFRADRIHAVSLLDVAADPPAQAVPRDLADGLFQPSPEDPLVRLWLGPGARWVADYYPCESVRERAGGALEVSLRAAELRWVRDLALRLGPQGRVLAPASLAAEVGQAAQRALRGYGADGGRPTGPD